VKGNNMDNTEYQADDFYPNPQDDLDNLIATLEAHNGLIRRQLAKGQYASVSGVLDQVKKIIEPYKGGDVS